MKKIPFDQALSKAQDWVGKNDIYAVGESLGEDGNKIILVFVSDTTKVTNIIPKLFHGHNVYLYSTGTIVPQDLEKME